MSIIGPRPLLVSYLPWYTEEEKQRHDVRPGLSGLAQVNGRNSVTWVYIYKYSDDPVLSVIVLLAFNLYQFSLTGMRQTIAISFVVLAIMAVHEEKKIQPYIWVLIASLFHSSALVCLSIPILSKIRISTIAIRIAPIPLMICFIFRNSIAGMRDVFS